MLAPESCHHVTDENIRGLKILCIRLGTELGIVSGRVALLLRSAEIKPLFDGFVLAFRLTSFS